MASIDFHGYRHPSASISDRFPSWLARLCNRLRLWLALAHERRHLRTLDDHLLRDIGLSRIQAGVEAGRPFWDTAGSKDRDIQV